MPVNAMDFWDGATYSRAVPLAGSAPVQLEVVQTGPPAQPVLRVAIPGRTSSAKQAAATAVLAHILGLDVDLAPFYRLARKDKRLNALTRPFVGFRPPRLPSIFEALLNGIACQQLSLNVGIQLLNRLCAAYGRGINGSHTFPRPQDLAEAQLDDLKRLGFSGSKSKAIVAIARSVTSGELDLESLSHMDNASAFERLRELHGIGRWTAQYVLLRGLGRLDIFPVDDVGAQNKLQRWLGLGTRPSAEKVTQILRPWSNYQGLIYFHLLLDELSRRGLLNPATTPEAIT
ncbi:MAG TPA: DNA-3-methyladenine glycosylase 2 [Tepidisphaeraceae bacterium]|nr:DNA-3-methyladenine glycosylase 2 [Tepidisphaeraceae bacterium]